MRFGLQSAVLLLLLSQQCALHQAAAAVVQELWQSQLTCTTGPMKLPFIDSVQVGASLVLSSPQSLLLCDVTDEPSLGTTTTLFMLHLTACRRQQQTYLRLC